MYVGRCKIDGYILPAKVVPNKKKCYIAWEHEEYIVNEFEVLTGDNYSWIQCNNLPIIPPCAVRVGCTAEGKPLYCGRGYIHNALTPGIINAENNGLVVPFNGDAYTLHKYEILVQPIVWISASGTSIAPEAVLAGNDLNGDFIYVGRAYHLGELLPAKIVSNKSCAYISSEGMEIKKYDFDFLVGKGFCWIAASHGEVPNNAVICGQAINGAALYAGRCHYKGTLTPGKINTVEKCLKIPFNGYEIEIAEYEVLCRSENDFGPREKAFEMPSNPLVHVVLK